MINYQLLSVALIAVLIGIGLGFWLTCAGIWCCIERGTMDLFINGVRQTVDKYQE